ncbi:hypothetical protein [Dolichospermum phage Dfl-JY23]
MNTLNGYSYHVAFQSCEQGDHVGRDIIILTEKITSKNYNTLLTTMENVLKTKYGFECVVTYFQLLEDR